MQSVFEIENTAQLASELLAHKDNILKEALESLIIHDKTQPKHEQNEQLKNIPDNPEPMDIEKLYAVGYVRAFNNPFYRTLICPPISPAINVDALIQASEAAKKENKEFDLFTEADNYIIPEEQRRTFEDSYKELQDVATLIDSLPDWNLESATGSAGESSQSQNTQNESISTTAPSVCQDDEDDDSEMENSSQDESLTNFSSIMDYNEDQNNPYISAEEEDIDGESDTEIESNKDTFFEYVDKISSFWNHVSFLKKRSAGRRKKQKGEYNAESVWFKTVSMCLLKLNVPIWGLEKMEDIHYLDHSLLADFKRAAWKLFNDSQTNCHKISMCSNFCMLFYGENSSLTECLHCKSTRRSGLAINQISPRVFIQQLFNDPVIAKMLKFRPKETDVHNDVWKSEHINFLKTQTVTTFGPDFTTPEPNTSSDTYFKHSTDICMSMHTDGINILNLKNKNTVLVVGIIHNLPLPIRFKRPFIVPLMAFPKAVRGNNGAVKDYASFLQPIVDDFKDMGKGFNVFDADLKTDTKVRCFLSFISGNMPDICNMCGYVNHDSIIPCCTCLGKKEGRGIPTFDFNPTLRNIPLERGREWWLEFLKWENRMDGEDAIKKLHTSFGLKFKSPILQLFSIQPPYSLVYDTTHLFYENISKEFLMLLLDPKYGDETTLLAKENKIRFENILEQLNLFTPPYWKGGIFFIPWYMDCNLTRISAHQFSAFLEVIPILLIELEGDRELLKIFSLLALSIRTMSSTSIPDNILNSIANIVSSAVNMFENLFVQSDIKNTRYDTLSLHFLNHMVQYILKTGNPLCFSSLAIKRKINLTNNDHFINSSVANIGNQLVFSAICSFMQGYDTFKSFQPGNKFFGTAIEKEIQDKKIKSLLERHIKRKVRCSNVDISYTFYERLVLESLELVPSPVKFDSSVRTSENALVLSYYSEGTPVIKERVVVDISNISHPVWTIEGLKKSNGLANTYFLDPMIIFKYYETDKSAAVHTLVEKPVYAYDKEEDYNMEYKQFFPRGWRKSK